ncbi:MAG: DUF669 domain-containing protein [Lachnospiraceae bacterium]|nr:DUF669 domain-containing protein [Lachnospiraceae bacterium]
MADMFSKWDKEIDIEGLQKDIADAAENGGNFKEVPHGIYEVAVHQMELKASKKGDPMVSIWFKVIGGEYENSMIFYNQVITQGFQVHMVNEMLRKMCEEMGANMPVIEFQSYKQYANLLMDIFEAVAENYEFGLKYAANSKNKDFSTYEITEVFVLE